MIDQSNGSGYTGAGRISPSCHSVSLASAPVTKEGVTVIGVTSPFTLTSAKVGNPPN